MSRTLLVVSLVATAALYYLGVVDRLSPAAMYVVELQTRLGIPPWTVAAALAGLGLAGVLLGLGRGAPAAPPVRRTTAPRAAPIATDGDWYTNAAAAARALPLTPAGRMRTDEAPGLPFSLVLQGATMEQARRRLELYASFLASIPTPPRGRVHLESCPDITMAPQLLVAAAFKPHHAAESHVVRASGGVVDIVFAQPDPRWAARG